MYAKRVQSALATNASEFFREKAFQTISTAVRKVDCGRPKKTTAVEDRYIVLQGVISFQCHKQFSTLIDMEREVGTLFHPSNITERDRYGGPGVVVWGGVMQDERTKFHAFDRGSVTGDLYCKVRFMVSFL
ncbi:hypothetical protein TNCV_3461851 [Trichonephila clavipes]|nr:hypothetical protein TNCV_3461851 [Trichonephila clavipes]